MTDKEINDQLKALEEVTAKALESKESAIKFLQDAGILDQNGKLIQRFQNVDEQEEE
jgi:hypothetical protein